jgi:hypothetical protein
MCQDLPCIDADVELLRPIIVRDVQIRRGARGRVVRENLPARAVDVYFSDYQIEAPDIPERDLRAIAPPPR